MPTVNVADKSNGVVTISRINQKSCDRKNPLCQSNKDTKTVAIYDRKHVFEKHSKRVKVASASFSIVLDDVTTKLTKKRRHDIILNESSPFATQQDCWLNFIYHFETELLTNMKISPNYSVLCFGASGAGKSNTLFGNLPTFHAQSNLSIDWDCLGIIPRFANHFFEQKFNFPTITTTNTTTNQNKMNNTIVTSLSTNPPLPILKISMSLIVDEKVIDLFQPTGLHDCSDPSNMLYSPTLGPLLLPQSLITLVTWDINETIDALIIGLQVRVNHRISGLMSIIF